MAASEAGSYEPRRIPETVCAYTAGLFDGEGCITIGRRAGRQSYRLRVKLVAANRTIPVFLQTTFGGTVAEEYSRRKGSTYYRWVSHTNQAGLFLVYILPYLMLKREQAILALDFQAKRANLPPQYKKLIDWTAQFSEDAHVAKTISVLNTKGKK